MQHLILCCLLALGFLAGLPRVAAAAPLFDGPQVATAQRLAQEGSRALSANNFPLALQKLELAYSKAQLPEVLYLLGKTAQLERRELAAVDLYRRYLAATDGEADLQKKAEIEQFISSVHEPPTELEVISPDVGAVLRVDGRIVGVLPLGTPLLVSGGSHRFLVERNRQSFETNALQIAAGQRVQLQLALESRYAVLSVATGVILLLHPQNASPVVQQQLRAALQPSLQQVHGFLIQSERTELALAKVNPGGEVPCPQSLVCQEKLARSLDATHVITLTLKPSLASPKQVGLQVFDSGTGAIADSAQDDCDSCTPETLRERIERLAQRVLQVAWNRGRGSLQITSEPVGATVILGGRTLGVTPFSREVFEGELALELALDGFLPHTSKREITRGHQTVVRVVLERPVVPPPTVDLKPQTQSEPVRRSRPMWRLGSGLALAGAGVILGGLGISALAADGGCVTEPMMVGDVCPIVRNTKVPAGALMGVGGASLIAGIIVAAWPP